MQTIAISRLPQAEHVSRFRRPAPTMRGLAGQTLQEAIESAKTYCATQIANTSTSGHSICVIWYLANYEANPNFDTMAGGGRSNAAYDINQVADVLRKYVQLVQAKKCPEYDVANGTTETVIRTLVKTYPNHSENFYRVVMHNMKLGVDNEAVLPAVQYPETFKALIEKGDPDVWKMIDKRCQEITKSQDDNSLLSTLKTAAWVIGGVIALSFVLPMVRR